MAFDLQHDGWEDAEARREFGDIRAVLISGLIRLAGAEGIPQGMTQEPSQELSDDGRRRLLKETLEDLSQALDRLVALIAARPPNVPADLGGGAALSQAVQDAIADVRTGAGAVDGATGEDLKDLPRRIHPRLSRLINVWCPVRKIFVAVHGIGDQFQSETVQTVAFRVCDYVGVPSALPLGRFHGPGGTVTKAFVPEPDRDPPINCGFAEIYWANVPRIPAADKHILEEPRKWARTLVERLRLRGRGEERRTREDDERLERLIEELIDGVNVANRLVFLADKAGLFKFELGKLLNDYLNDVQVVTEFEDYRRQMLDIFDDIMEKIHRYFDAAELYIVAHSEGTVVSFIGLLKGLSERAPWAGSIKGYMTIGSPLNKHVRFWPELFDRYRAADADPDLPPIPWKNYYDYGDPIAYNLAPTRGWMADTHWDRFFAFNDARNVDDIGFSRYPFPGAAHNDYWRDEAVFGHFIEEVVDRTNTVLPRARARPYGPPRTRVVADLAGYPMPYVLSAGLLFLACYLLYKAVRGCLDPIGARFDTPGQVFFNVLGLTGIVGAMSLLARIPRLSRAFGWRALALLLAVPFSAAYFWVSGENRGSIEKFLLPSAFSDPYLNVYNASLIAALVVGMLLLLVEGLRPVLLTLLPIVGWILVLRVADVLLSTFPLPGFPALPWRSLGVISVAWLVGILAWRISWLYPSVGTKPLVYTGGLIILMVVATQITLHRAGFTAEERATIETGLKEADPLAVARAASDKVRDTSARLEGIYRAKEERPADRAQDSPEVLAADRRLLEDAAGLQVVADAPPDKGPIWPVFLAGAAFLYIWWLAIILFDLTFVWHLYIRWSGAQRYIDERLA